MKLLLVLMLMVMTTSGCGGGSSSSVPYVPEPEPESTAQKTITPAPESASPDVPARHDSLKTVTLNNGISMPTLDIGTYTLSSSQAENSVYWALREGFRLIDTARIYGNEEGVGRGIRRAISEGLVTRGEIFVTTKMWTSDYSNGEAAIEASLSRLGLEYIDLMILHHSQPANDVQAYKSMENALRSGKLRAIGLSNYYSPEDFDRLVNAATVHPAVLQNETHPYYQGEKMKAHISQYGTVMESWYPLGGRGHTQENFMRLILAMAFVVLMAFAVNAEEVKYIEAPKFKGQIYLYGEPDKADVDFEQWYEIQGRGQFVRNVKVPSLIPYLPDLANSNGAAIIIAPGGAFLHHTFGSGGYEAVEWFRSQGFATFILKYRVEITPREEADYQAYVAKMMGGYRAGGRSGNYAPATPDYAFEDVNAAVKLLRERAEEFHIRPDRIGIIGFSAGALMAVYNAESAKPECKADFIASIYGQLVMREVPDKLPPLFAAMSSDDELSGQSGFEVIQAWQKRGVAELHLYGQGGHNFGMGHEPFTNYLWPGQFMAWLRMLGLINQPASTAKITLNNGLDMPQFGIGTFRSDPQQAHDAVLTALRAGYRHIDTAHAYQNERGVGAAVKESGIPRSEIWIPSKLWPTDYASGNVEESINKMLERLGTDYIDLLYLHQPVGDYMAGWRGLESAVKAGKVRAIGLSNFDLSEERFNDIITQAEIKPAIVQIELHPYAQRKAFRERGLQYNSGFTQ